MPTGNSKIWTIIMERVQFTENYLKKIILQSIYLIFLYIILALDFIFSC